MADLIPGTSQLVDESTHKQKKGDIVLIPQPSSDANDPLNWSLRWKNLHFGILFLYTLVNAGMSHWTLSVYTLFTSEFGVSYRMLNTGNGVQYLVLAFSCLLSQPMANKLGRRPTFLLASVGAVVALVVFSTVKSYTGYIVFSVLVGVAVAPMDTIIQISVNDIFFLDQHGRYMALYFLALALGSNFGPLVAGYITRSKLWDWCPYVLVILTGLVLVIAVLFLEESLYHRSYSKEAFPKRRPVARRMGFNFKNTRSDLFALTIAPMWTFKYPAVVFGSFCYGIQICWLALYGVTVSQFFSQPPYNFSPDALGNLNVAGVLGALFGAVLLMFLDPYHVWKSRRNGGVCEPEFRLQLSLVPIVINTLGIFLYGFGPAYHLHWIVGAIGICLMNIGIICLTTLSITYVLECYPKQASQTMVAILFVRNIMGAIFTWVFQHWLEGVGVKGTVTMLGVFCFVFNSTVLIIIVWGKKFRANSAQLYLARTKSNDSVDSSVESVTVSLEEKV